MYSSLRLPRRTEDHLSSRNGSTQLCRARRAFSMDRNPNIAYESILKERASDSLYRLPKLDWSIGEIARLYNTSKINLFPEYQRGYVWNENDKHHSRASRLVVTVLCNRFIPPVVLHEKKKGVWDVVDGKQRLSSLLAFYFHSKQVAKSPVPGFTQLGGLKEEYAELNGLTFAQLTEDRQNGFESYNITVFSMVPTTPADDVFSVYVDINSGGTSLTMQQLRRAAYYGNYVRLLDDLCENKDFLNITRATGPVSTEKDREMVLRAFAFYNSAREYKPPLAFFLNRELRENQNLTQEQEDTRRKHFQKVMSVAKDLLGDDAFRRQKGTRAISLPIWDSLYCALATILFADKITPMMLQKNSDAIRRSLAELLRNRLHTTKSSFHDRHELMRACILQNCGKPAEQGPRFFSSRPDLKQQLYDKQSGRCAICGNLMHTAVEAAVDHIDPHALGGKTDWETNAQLVHPRCNSSKGAR